MTKQHFQRSCAKSPRAAPKKRGRTQQQVLQAAQEVGIRQHIFEQHVAAEAPVVPADGGVVDRLLRCRPRCVLGRQSEQVLQGHHCFTSIRQIYLEATAMRCTTWSMQEHALVKRGLSMIVFEP